MPAWFVNDAKEEVYEIDGTTKTLLNGQRVLAMDDSTDTRKGKPPHQMDGIYSVV